MGVSKNLGKVNIRGACGQTKCHIMFFNTIEVTLIVQNWAEDLQIGYIEERI